MQSSPHIQTSLALGNGPDGKKDIDNSDRTPILGLVAHLFSSDPGDGRSMPHYMTPKACLNRTVLRQSLDETTRTFPQIDIEHRNPQARFVNDGER